MSATARVSPGVPLAFYLANVDRETDTCILWPYATNSRGYGKLWLVGERRIAHVHILACERHHGPRPEGMDACHAPVICHNPLCFNAKGGHVSWESPETNLGAHRALDGTDNRGEKHPLAKLSWVKVDEIRARWAAGDTTCRELAVEYGVSRQTIGDIVFGRGWLHPPPVLQ